MSSCLQILHPSDLRRINIKLRRLVVKAPGGLGNRLFVYAAAAVVAKRTGAQIFTEADAASTNASRLGAFDLMVDSGSCRRPRPPQSPRLLGNRLWNGLTTRVYPQALDRSNRPIRGGKLRISGSGSQAIGILSGYFQSSQWVDEAIASGWPDEVPQLIVSEPMVKTFLTDQMRDRPVGVHVRLGDYAERRNRVRIGQLDDQYYRQALATVRSLGFHGPVWLFSDELSSALAFLQPTHEPLIPIDVKSPSAAIFLMSSCSALVLANSTLSWWAGRWSTSETIVAPSPWTKANLGSDLGMSHWIQLPCAFD